jgi:histone H3/H4
MTDAGFWKRCNICKAEIGFEQTYYLCSVSTCNRKRTGLVFCSVGCFDAHLPMMRHRDAWAEQEVSPSEAQARREAEEERDAESDSKVSAASAAASLGRESGSTGSRRIVGVIASDDDRDASNDTLVVASKLKKYIRARSGMNTSDGVISVLSSHLRELSVSALRHAAEEGRKTVLDRDFVAVIDEFKARPR